MPPQWAKEHKNLKPGPEPAVVRRLVEPVPVPPVLPVPEPAHDWKYHLKHYVRDAVLVGGVAALAYVASDDFATLLNQHPEIAAYVPLLQLAARGILSAIAAAKAKAQ
jgi:hypothetical protein